MKTTRDVKGSASRFPRPDGPEKVTGRVQYVADLQPRGLLHAKLLRSPHAHARILRIDTIEAKALPGVRAVLTAADIPQLKKKAPTRAHAVLAIDRVVFVGQPVAAVAADELAIAEEALRPHQGRVPGPARLGGSAEVHAARRAAGGGLGHRGRHQRGARPLRQWPSPRTTTDPRRR